MAKETLLFSIRTQLSDRDFDDVYRVYLQEERGKDRKTALITCGVIAAVFLILLIVFHNMTFLIYAGACLVVAGLYFTVPVNRKFLAQNKLQFGEKREITFFPHHISVFELLDDEENLSDEEKQEATTEFSTGMMKAYENERGFLFAEGKISNQFLYIPKRQLDAEDSEKIREYAKNRCSAGYLLLEMRTMLDGSDGTDDADEDSGDSIVSGACDQYYGIGNLHLRDEDGKRVTDESLAQLEAEDEAQQAAHTETVDETDMDVDAEWEKIISEDTDD